MIEHHILKQFSGSEGLHHTWMSKMMGINYTDGAQYVFQNGGDMGAYWLLDIILSYQPKLRKQLSIQDLQVWKAVKDGDQIIITCEDGDGDIFITQKGRYDLFDNSPGVEKITLWLMNNVIYLPSEH